MKELRNSAQNGENLIFVEDTYFYVDDRSELSAILVVMAKEAFSILEQRGLNLTKAKTLLLDSFKSINQGSPNTLIHRSEAFNAHLGTAISLISRFWNISLKLNKSDLYDDSVGKYDSYQEFDLTERVEDFVKQMDKITTRPLNFYQNSQASRRYSCSHQIGRVILPYTALSKGFLHHLYTLHPDLFKFTTGRDFVDAEVEVEKEDNSLLDWLQSYPDVFKAYSESQETLNEVTPLLNNAEDEYFVEQVTKEYYPQIFDSLRELEKGTMTLNSKESVVVETLKQLKIIQLGLQKIMDGIVSHRFQALQRQTDFLRNKVLQETQLSLTEDESDKLVEASLEEANRVREALYKQHVAPTLEKNKQEYEAALESQKQVSLEDKQSALDKQQVRHEAKVESLRNVIKSKEKEYGSSMKESKIIIDQLTTLLNKKDALHRKIELELNEHTEAIESGVGILRTSYKPVNKMMVEKTSDASANNDNHGDPRENSLLKIMKRIHKANERIQTLTSTLKDYQRRGVAHVAIKQDLEDAQFDLRQLHQTKAMILVKENLEDVTEVLAEVESLKVSIAKDQKTLGILKNLNSDSLYRSKNMGRYKKLVKDQSAWMQMLEEVAEQTAYFRHMNA